MPSPLRFGQYLHGRKGTAHDKSENASYAAKAQIQAAVSVTAAAIFFAFPITLYTVYVKATVPSRIVSAREWLWMIVYWSAFFLCTWNIALHHNLQFPWVDDMLKQGPILSALCTVLIVIIPYHRGQVFVFVASLSYFSAVLMQSCLLIILLTGVERLSGS